MSRTFNKKYLIPFALIAIKSLPGLNLEKFYEETGDTGRTVNMEASISCKRGEMREVILTAFRVELMGQHGIIIVTRDTSQQPVGIVTDCDLRNRVVAREFNVNRPVFEIMNSPLIRIPDEALLWKTVLVKILLESGSRVKNITYLISTVTDAILDNKFPDNMITREELTVIEQTMIRKTFSEVIRYQQEMLDDFSV